jgi:succinyl-diaminopimelate desuccinylase
MTSPFDGPVTDVCVALLSTPSEYGDEELLAGMVEAHCRHLGIRHERLGNAVVARTGAGGDGVALVGHLDTVPNWEGGGVHVAGDRIVGRGAADMKGGDAVMLRLLGRLQDADPPVVFVFYDREEGPNDRNGIHQVLERSRLLGRPGFAVVLEPTGNTIHAGAVGTMNADVVVRGKLAHSARPWEGVNAVDRSAPLLARFAARAPEPVDVEGLRFHDTVTITMAHAGNARNVVPDEFRLAVNVRVAPGRSLEDARAEVERLAGPEGEVTWLDASPSCLPGVTAPAVQDFIRATGLAVHPKQAWTDVATLSAAGIPAINYGPGESSQAHQRDEWVSAAALEQCEDVLLSFLRAGA